MPNLIKGRLAKRFGKDGCRASNEPLSLLSASLEKVEQKHTNTKRKTDCTINLFNNGCFRSMKDAMQPGNQPHEL